MKIKITFNKSVPLEAQETIVMCQSKTRALAFVEAVMSLSTRAQEAIEKMEVEA